MFEQPEQERPWLSRPPTVAAVLVSHNGQRWLSQVLASLGVMDFAPVDWHAVDVASTDGSGELLRDTFGPERITYAPSGTGFGDAVRLALEKLPPTEWIWLLHDDVAVQPGTLAGLLDEALSADDVAVVGPKIREWPSLKRLLEVGLTLTGTAGRETGLEPGEPDAGQHDRPRDVLAVNTAGMLVRRSVWDELGGFDPSLRLHGDDLDFGWRVARAGHRTRTAPGAVVFHAEGSTRGSRRQSAGDVHSSERRRAALFTVLANTDGGLRFAWTAVRLFMGSLLRMFGFLVAADPESAGDELVALQSVYRHPGRMRAARRARRAAATVPGRDLRHLFPPTWLPYLHGLDAARDMVAAVVRPEAATGAGRRSSRPLEGPEETEDLDDRPGLLMSRPWLLTVVVLVVLSLVAARGLVSGGPWHGGALLPSPDTAGGWWQLFVERGHRVGTGSTTQAPAFVLLLAVAATPFWPAPHVVLTFFMVLAVPLAALTSHRLGRRLTDSRAHRIVWALTYGLALVATGAVSQGRLGTVVALVVLPIVVTTALQLVEVPRWQTALRLGVWVAVATAFSPVVYLGALVGAIALAVRPTLRRLLVITVLVPWPLLGPWMVQRVVHPQRWWWEAGVPVSSRVPSGLAAARDLLLGRAGGPGAATPWLSVGVLVLALAALVLCSSARRPAVLAAWAVALVGLAAAVAGSFASFTTPASGASYEAWVGVPAVVWIGGLATAALLGLDDLRPSSRTIGAVLVVVALVLPVGTAAWWLARGEKGPVTRGTTDVVPAYLAERPGSTLVLTGSIADGIDYQVVQAASPTLGQEAVVAPAGRSAAATALVRTVLAQPSRASIDALARDGVSAIYAPHADAEVARRLDAEPGLSPSGAESPTSRVWTIDTGVTTPAVHGPWWRPVVAVLEALAWLVAIVLTAPVKRRRRNLEEVP